MEMSLTINNNQITIKKISEDSAVLSVFNFVTGERSEIDLGRLDLYNLRTYFWALEQNMLYKKVNK